MADKKKQPASPAEIKSFKRIFIYPIYIILSIDRKGTDQLSISIILLEYPLHAAVCDHMIIQQLNAGDIGGIRQIDAFQQCVRPCFFIHEILI